jgi:hypothetical protein
MGLGIHKPEAEGAALPAILIGLFVSFGGGIPCRPFLSDSTNSIQAYSSGMTLVRSAES